MSKDIYMAFSDHGAHADTSYYGSCFDVFLATCTCTSISSSLFHGLEGFQLGFT